MDDLTGGAMRGTQRRWISDIPSSAVLRALRSPMFRAPETISTPRLRLRPPVDADVDAVFAYASDPRVTRFMDWPTHRSVADSRAFIDSVGAAWASGNEFTWLITVGGDTRPIGAVGCQPKGHAMDFGYVLEHAHWGNGYATEAARAIVELGRATPGIWRIAATCDHENVASARVLEKVGLRREARLRAATMRPNPPPNPPSNPPPNGVDPRPRDTLVYAWVREA